MQNEFKTCTVNPVYNKLFCFILFICITVLYSQDLDSVLARIDQMTKDEMAKDNNQAACAICVTVDDSLVFAKGYGLADIKKNIPARANHIFRIGSITKQITGLMVLQLEEEGKLQFSDEVETYFPEFSRIKNKPSGSPPVTFQLLGTMTAGLAREPRNTGNYTTGPVARWEKILISALSDTRYDLMPGSQYKYSNIGYGSLGLAAAQAGDTNYISYVKNRTFKELGIADSDFDRTPEIAPMVAKGYVLSSSGPNPSIPEKEHAGRGYKVPNGAMYASVVGFAKYLAFQLGYGPETVLKWDNLQKNYRTVISSNGSLKSSYGIGFMASKSSGLVRIGHSGSVAGYGAGAYVNRETLTGVAVFRSASNGRFSASGLASRALNAVAKFRKGKVPPFLSIVGPLKNAVISGTPNPFRAIAFDPDQGTDDGDGMESVVFELLQGSTVLGKFTDKAPPFQWPINSNDYPDGQYQLRATATSSGSSGEKTSISQIPILIDNGQVMISNFAKGKKKLFFSQYNQQVRFYVPYSSILKITCVDMKGRELVSFHTTGKKGWYPVDLKDKGAGLYLVRVGQENNQLFNLAFIITH